MTCRLNQRSFSKCIEFSDTNYQLAQPDDRTATFEYLCDLYNYVDASIHVQFSFVNRRTDPAQYARSFEIAPQGDDFDDIRAEYTSMSIVVSSLTDDIVDPVEMAEWAYKNGGWCSKSGSYHSLIPNAAKAWGCLWRAVRPLSPSASWTRSPRASWW